MNIDFARFAGRRRSWFVGVVAAGAAALTLVAATPAWAAEDATATVATIGSGGSYLVSVQDNSSEEISSFTVNPEEEVSTTNIRPSSGCGGGEFPGTLTCDITIAPGATGQMCYTGHALGELNAGIPDGDGINVFFGSPPKTQEDFPVSVVSAVASCPVSSGGGTGTGGGGTGGGSGGGSTQPTTTPTTTPTTAPTKCKKGFKKKKVHGKEKCVKVKKKHKH